MTDERIDIRDLTVELCRRLGVEYHNVMHIELEQGFGVAHVNMLRRDGSGKPMIDNDGASVHSVTRKVLA
jgi:hypothetical protein